ncbi:MAG: energy transducer TonB [Rhodospirillales bacterium]|nr:energy transducer TonB [Rhodospirillales bacterium]
MRRPLITRRPRRHPAIITPVTETVSALEGAEMFVAGEHLAPPAQKPRRNPWAWGAALLLHVLVIAAVLLVREKPPQEDLQSPPGVSVVFNNGGTAPQATAPRTTPGPPQQMQAPPPPPPPAPASPAEQAQAATQDEVQVPDLPLAAIPNPPPAPHPRPAPRQRVVNARRSPPSQQKYVFLNGMNYGNVSPVAPPVPQAPRGMNFSLPTSDAQAATASDFSVKGDAGADWDAALSKWVQDHAYYPQAAAEQGQEGTATVQFTVDRHGHVTGLKLLDSAGSPFLDQAWEQLFEDNTLPPFPPDAKDGHVTVQYTVHYVLIH